VVHQSIYKNGIAWCLASLIRGVSLGGRVEVPAKVLPIPNIIYYQLAMDGGNEGHNGHLS